MILEVDHLSKSFWQGKTQIHALKDISFQVSEQKSLAIIGPSGSGKTTLLSLLAGLDQPSEGLIRVNGTQLSELDEQQLTQFRGQNIGIVFQQFHLMPHLTALENVCLPLDIQGSDSVKERAEEILAMVGLSQRKNHLPHQLSGGESQRVAIARAFVVKPKLLLADEPSGNLDTDTGIKVMDLLFDMADKSKMTLVLITHDSRLASRCEMQIKLMGGTLQ